MALSARGNTTFFSRLKSLAKLQKFNHQLIDGSLQAPLHREMASSSEAKQDHVDKSMWKRVDSRMYGITRFMITPPSYTVLKVLQSEGFEAYLVGGCVRDLLLKKVPKDYDVITTANHKQIKKLFHRAEIVGWRFPICIVHVKGSTIEVSSFGTVAKKRKGKEKHPCPQIPKGRDDKDIRLWKNSLDRDFTVNSLFYDPFVNKIYDYANGIMDIGSLHLRTLVPAQISFEEDCARILRGIRIAARLGLSISKDTITAIHKLSSSIMSLSPSRIMMELNYMLSYGAAEPSMSLLRRFNLLKLMLPYHAAYLDQQARNHASERSSMLLRLFSNLDKLVTCDRPCSCRLWVGLLAFHMALINKPQDPLVVWTFSSVLYHGNWEDGVNYASEHAQEQVKSPEICEPSDHISDTNLVKKVAQFASVVQASIDTLVDKQSLVNSMSRFSLSPCSDLVFIPKKTGMEVAQLFDVLVDDIESYKHRRMSFDINYESLGKGNLNEIRFAIGKVILDTISGGKFQRPTHDGTLKNHPTLSNTLEKRCYSPSYSEMQVKMGKRQKVKETTTGENIVNKTIEGPQEISGKHKKTQKKTIQEKMEQKKSPDEIKKRITKVSENPNVLQDETEMKPHKVLGKCDLSVDKKIEQQEVIKENNGHSPQVKAGVKNEKDEPVNQKRNKRPLSNLFR